MSRRNQIIRMMVELNSHRLTLAAMRDEVESFIDDANEHNSEEVLEQAHEEANQLNDAVCYLDKCLDRLDATTRDEE